MLIFTAVPFVFLAFSTALANLACSVFTGQVEVNLTPVYLAFSLILDMHYTLASVFWVTLPCMVFLM